MHILVGMYCTLHKYSFNLVIIVQLAMFCYKYNQRLVPYRKKSRGFNARQTVTFPLHLINYIVIR